MTRARVITSTISALLLCTFGLVHAVRVQRLSLTEVRERADGIIVVHVSSESTRVGDGAKMVWTDYQVQVNETLAGDPSEGTRTISFAGGYAKGLEVGIADVPRLQVGKRYVLFLLPEGRPWATPTIGWGQGIFELITDPSAAVESLVSYDGEPLELTASGIRRGARIGARNRESGVLVVGDNADREPKEAEPMALDPYGNVIEQPPRPVPETVVTPKEGELASLDDLRRFVRGELPEDTRVGR
jgi:hypothetical protein